MYIHDYIRWRQNRVVRNGSLFFETPEDESDKIILALYQHMGISYPKFFKMDLLSRAAFLAAALAVPETIGEDKDHIATAISTASGCLDVDQKFEAGRSDLASPALFVYTLPNIMLGEICIRYGFKGEQLCTVAEQPDLSMLYFSVADLIGQRGTQACLCGHAEATAGGIDVTLLWVSRERSALPFTPAALQQCFNLDS